MTREEILDKHDGYKVPAIVSTDCALKAMDDFAKQEAIEFAEFISNVNMNGVDNNPELKIVLIDGQYYWESDNDGDQPISEEQLYILFLQSKKQP